MKIELNNNEAQVLVQFIDTAVKALGLQAAEAAVVLTRKISEASAAESQSPAEERIPPSSPAGYSRASVVESILQD